MNFSSDLRIFFIRHFNALINVLLISFILFFLFNFIYIDVVLAEELANTASTCVTCKVEAPVHDPSLYDENLYFALRENAMTFYDIYKRNFEDRFFLVNLITHCKDCYEPEEVPGIYFLQLGLNYLFFFPEFFLCITILFLLILNLFFKKYNFSFDIVNLNIYLTLLSILFTIYLLWFNIPYTYYIFNNSFIINN